MTIGDSTQIINGTSCPIPSGSTGDVLGVWTLDVTAVAGFSQRGTPVTFDGLSVAYWTRTRDGSEGANISMTGGPTSRPASYSSPRNRATVDAT